MTLPSYQSILKRNIETVNKSILNISTPFDYEKKLDYSTNLLEKPLDNEKFVEVVISVKTDEIFSKINFIISDKVAIAIEYFMLMGTIEYNPDNLIVTEATVDALQEYVQMILDATKADFKNSLEVDVNFKILELKLINSIIDLELTEFKYFNSYHINNTLNELSIDEEVYILYDISTAELFREKKEEKSIINSTKEEAHSDFNVDNVIINIEDCENNKKIYRDELDNLKLLLGVELKLSVRIGSKIMLLKDIVNIDIGTTIELDQLAKEPLDILINEVKIAEGEIIIINGKFGVQISKISTKVERLSKLRYKV